MKFKVQELERKNETVNNIILTGGSRGLGLIIAETLLKNGYYLYIVNRNVSNELHDLNENYKNQFKVLKFDLSKPERIHEVVFKNWIGLKTPIHGLVNNAALAYDDIVTNMNFESLESMFKVNVYSPMILAKYAIRQMLYQNNPGSLVHISSISVHTGYKGLAMYAASKGALEAFSKNTAREWGERQIRSNTIVAGFMETDMNESLSMEMKDRIYKRTSLKESTSKESVANTVEFLISQKSKSITGQDIFVDNGTI